jgi:hypothetical protein
VDWVDVLAIGAAAQIAGTWVVLAVLSINRGEQKD